MKLRPSTFGMLVASIMTTGPGAAQTETPPPRFADMRKAVIEAPVKRIISTATSSLLPSQTSDRKPAIERWSATRVPPGLVDWHPDFESACRAAANSNKPVLLFQMLGRLDDRFC